MAIFHFHTSIIKASKGKCAVASAAYISAESLYDKRLGQTFSYTRKEEVVFSEILLPKNAPEHLRDRETLWNEVERVQNKANSRYARQFDMALPVELDCAQMIELSRKFIVENFVNKGMAVDWALHDKAGNPHIHVMCTVRGFNKNGTWASMEKKEYARDENGEKIPDIDPSTGEQKVRVRKGKGVEKLWKRITVEANTWNSRTQLYEWRKNWAAVCNEYLSLENHIDHRSYAARGITKIPTIHEGAAAKEMAKRGEVVNVVEENKHRIDLNEKFAAIQRVEKSFRNELDKSKAKFIKRKEGHNAERERNRTGSGHLKGLFENDSRIREFNTPTARRIKAAGQGVGASEQNYLGTAGNNKQADVIIGRISFIRAKISDLIDRVRKAVEAFGDLGARKREVERVSRRITEVRVENKERGYLIRPMRSIIKANLTLEESYPRFLHRMKEIYDVNEDDLSFRPKGSKMRYIGKKYLGDEFSERMLRLYYMDNDLYKEIEHAVKKLRDLHALKQKDELCKTRYDYVREINLKISLMNLMSKYDIHNYTDVTEMLIEAKLKLKNLPGKKAYHELHIKEDLEILPYYEEYCKYRTVYEAYKCLDKSEQAAYRRLFRKQIETCENLMPHIESFLWGRSHLTPEDLKADIERNRQAAKQIEREIAENELKLAELELLRQGINETLHLELPDKLEEYEKAEVLEDDYELEEEEEEEEYEEPVRHRSYDYDR